MFKQSYFSYKRPEKSKFGVKSGPDEQSMHSVTYVCLYVDIQNEIRLIIWPIKKIFFELEMIMILW
jgi:hypothetical protein